MPVHQLPVIGLTGGIATGKSTVSTLLRAHHLPVVDADVLARKVVEPGTPALAQIVRAFGQDVLLPDGRLDRAKLGRIVFADEGKRRTLNAIVHPAVRREMFWSILRCWWRGERVCGFTARAVSSQLTSSQSRHLQSRVKRAKARRMPARTRFIVTTKVLTSDHNAPLSTNSKRDRSARGKESRCPS